MRAGETVFHNMMQVTVQRKSVKFLQITMDHLASIRCLYSSYDLVHQSLSCGHVNTVLAATTEDGPRDGIDLRYPPRGHILLHRASKSVGCPFERCQYRFGS